MWSEMGSTGSMEGAQGPVRALAGARAWAGWRRSAGGRRQRAGVTLSPLSRGRRPHPHSLSASPFSLTRPVPRLTKATATAVFYCVGGEGDV
jgi:hypothetical protein